MRLSGYYDVKLIDASTQQVKSHLQFSNIITDAGLNAIGAGLYGSGLSASGLQFIAVGSGSTTPQITDTSLVSEITRTSADGGFAQEVGSNASPEYSFLKVTRVFTTAQANGNLRELGFLSSTSVLFSRSLFKDSLGNPTVITKTAQDILQITYEIRISGPATDVTGTFDYAPLGSSTYTIRPQGINLSNQWNNALVRMGVWTSSSNVLIARASNSTFFNIRTGLNTPATDAASSAAPTTITVASYTAGTFYRDVTYVWRPSDGNLTGGLATFVFSPWELTGAGDLSRYLYQMSFSPALPKTIIRRFELTLRFSWTRV